MDSFDLDRAYGEGWSASNSGETKANPYPVEHFCHDAWEDGWYECYSANSKADAYNTDIGPLALIPLVAIVAAAILILYKLLFG